MRSFVLNDRRKIILFINIILIDIGIAEYATKRIEKERTHNIINTDINTLSDELYSWKRFVARKCSENLDNCTIELRNI